MGRSHHATEGVGVGVGQVGAGAVGVACGVSTGGNDVVGVTVGDATGVGVDGAAGCGREPPLVLPFPTGCTGGCGRGRSRTWSRSRVTVG